MKRQHAHLPRCLRSNDLYWGKTHFITYLSTSKVPFMSTVTSTVVSELLENVKSYTSSVFKDWRTTLVWHEKEKTQRKQQPQQNQTNKCKKKQHQQIILVTYIIQGTINPIWTFQNFSVNITARDIFLWAPVGISWSILWIQTRIT